MQPMDTSTNQGVATKVRYLAPEWRDSSQLAHIFDRDSRRANTVVKDVSVLDARNAETEPTITLNGFELFKFNSPISSFTDEGLIAQSYYPAISEFVKTQSGADEVYVRHHLIRTESKDDFNKAYARFVHCDFSLDTVRSASLNLLRDRKQDPEKYRNVDFAWYNSWQPFDHEVAQNPLAMLDAQTIHDGDIQEYNYGGNGKLSKSSIPIYSDTHQFYYYSNMMPNEVLLIKQMDSRSDQAAVAPHTSFIDPNSPADAPPRRSIEVRMMAVFR